MEKFISTKKLIKEAEKSGVNFGSGDPYNRLRYYTKIGWIPHMIRKSDKHGGVIGHYPAWTIERLVFIEKLKSQGLENDEISKKINFKDKIINIRNAVSSPETQKKATLYAALTIILLILMSELGIIKLGTPKNQAVYTTKLTDQVEITSSGTAFVPKNQTRIYVKNSKVTKNSKVYVTFVQNYSPASRFWVSSVESDKGFLIELDAPVYNNTEFNWWVSE